MKLSISVLLLVVLLVTITACESDLTALDLSASDREPRLVVTGFVATDGVVLSITQSIPSDRANFTPTDFFLTGNTTTAELADDNGNTYVLDYVSKRKQFVYAGTIPLAETYTLNISSTNLPEVTVDNLRFAGSENLTGRFSCAFDTSDVRSDFSTAGVAVTIDSPNSTYYAAFSLVEDQEENRFVRNHLISPSQDELVMSQCGWFVNDGILAVANTCFVDMAPVVEYNIRLSNFFVDSVDLDVVQVNNFPTRVGTVFGAISEEDYRYVRSLRRPEDLIEEYLVPVPPQTVSNVDGGYGYVMTINGAACWVDLE